MLCLKNNLAPESDGLAFDTIEDAQGRALIAWSPDPVHITADEVAAEMAALTDPNTAKLKQACDLVRDVLGDGAHHLAAELEELGRAKGISEKTLRRARRLLGVTVHKTGRRGEGKWWLSL